ncbi:hypothetical protein NBRC10513v2_002198 [Rhodotorula toruloides]
MPNWNKVNVFKRKERHRQGESSRTERLVLGGEHGHSHETDVGVQTDSEAGHDDDRDLLAAVDDAADRAYGFGPGHREMPNYSVFPQGGHPQPKKAPSSKEEIEALRAKAFEHAARRRR